MTKAQQIAAQLRTAGISSRQVSVRMSAGGSSIYAVVKDASVKLAAVKEIAGKFEHIDRDEGTGEILQGGNTFVGVSYSDDIMNAEMAKYLPAIEAITDRGSSHYTIAPGFTVSVDSRGWYQAWDTAGDSGRCIGCGWEPMSCARAIASAALAAPAAEVA